MWRIALGLWLSSFALGCETPQETRDESSCTVYCRCTTVETPSAQEECISECVEQLGPVDDDCATCIDEHAARCSTLEDDCLPLC